MSISSVLLMKQGHASDALEKFDEAVQFASTCQQLQLARELAIKGEDK